MVGESIILVKGTSGSGKSTRVFLFLDYLKSLGMEFTPYMFTNAEGVNKQVGIFSEDFNMVFVGKFYTDGSTERWQGHDSMTTRLCNSEGLSDFLKQTVGNGHSVLIEGAGTTATWRLRPAYLTGTTGFNNILHVLYNYEESQLEEYLARVVYRSGKRPKSDAMWKKNHTFHSDYKKAVGEAVELNKQDDYRVEVINRPFDAPLWDLGVHIFEFFGLTELCSGFKSFCKKSGYVERNSFKAFSDGKEK